MSTLLNERRAFDRRRKSLFRKGYDIQRLFQAKVYIVIERHGAYYAYRPSHRLGSWPPDKDAVEIRGAETFFPTDFQTVREAGMRGPVLSDNEDTPSQRAPSHGEPIPARSVEAEGEESRYPSFDDEADPHPPRYSHPHDQSRLHGVHTDASSVENPAASPAPTEMYDTPMSGIAVQDGRGRDFFQADEDEEEQKPIIDVNSSPGAADNTGYTTVDADMAQPTPRYIHHNQSAGRPVFNNGNGRMTSHVQGQELLQSIYPSLTAQPGGIKKDPGHSQASSERAGPQPRQQRLPMNRTPGSADEGRGLQVPEERTAQRLPHPNANDCIRHAVNSQPKRQPK
ncbi:hypothetical protein M4579_005215 [Neofusicoccum parvum]|nr:hypothetical protein M4579_005215 [Neofusicoccum parvum]